MRGGIRNGRTPRLSWGLLFGFAVVSPLILLGYAPVTLYNVTASQILEFASPAPQYASSDTFSFWTLVNGFHGLHGFDRIWAPISLQLTSHLSFATAGTIAFATIGLLTWLNLWRINRGGDPNAMLFSSLALVMTAYVVFSTHASARYLLLALPFVILALANSASIIRFGMVCGLTAVALVSMYGLLMVIAIRGEWPSFYGLGNPATNSLSHLMYSIYTSDAGIWILGAVLVMIMVSLANTLVEASVGLNMRRQDRYILRHPA